MPQYHQISSNEIDNISDKNEIILTNNHSNNKIKIIINLIIIIILILFIYFLFLKEIENKNNNKNITMILPKILLANNEIKTSKVIFMQNLIAKMDKFKRFKINLKFMFNLGGI